ncbi:hypothetical protein CBR_g55205 [Chara braunii]|uniref:Uncharacterized protein n=1 Tax=Chara braunii TaxID=69332 RepID=A0A388MCV3_CHABU|nr:hypothetical protein CBR_g55205 [Chara braunii]|eukprot:GBG92325.1 hypothetical protein CBR_g55205 [Chara braunii]
MKAVCELALGRKVDLPGDEETEVCKLRIAKELDELKAKCGSSTAVSNLESLRKEEEALIKMQDVRNNEQRLCKEIKELKAKVNDGHSDKNSDEVVALKLQVRELNGFRRALEEKNCEVASLRKENTHLRNDFKELKEQVLLLKNPGKRGGTGVVEKSPPEAPSRGKMRPNAMYTPKDMEGLYKAYKEALEGKELALREADALKDRLTKAGAAKYCMFVRRSAVRKTTPRNLKTAMNAVEVESDGDKEAVGTDEERRKVGGPTIVDAAHELEQAMLRSFRRKG